MHRPLRSPDRPGRPGLNKIDLSKEQYFAVQAI
jgi:hypothetical protein